jgi:O-antigen/teichoic acid export membrane protein
MSLRRQAISGIKWTGAASLINAFIQLLQLAILTRFLEPAEFGLMALVMAVVSFSQTFVDMGVSNAIIYKEKISKQQLSSLYWLNIFIGIIFFILLNSVSSFISNFYDNKELTSLINIIAITFLIRPWGQQFLVLLQKRLQFNIISKVDVISRLISFITIVILAYMGFGVYALAIGALTFTLFTAIGYMFFGRKFHKPTLHFKMRSLKEFLSFGLYQMGENILRFFSAEFDTILIGKLLGLEALGVYNVSKNLITKPYMVINPIITKVAFPLMSQIKGDIVRLRSVFLKIVNNLAYVNIPIYIMISFFARPLVLILFGAEWLNAVPIIQILSFTYLFRALGNPSGSLLLSQGKANIAFYWNLSVFALYPISILIGYNWGIIGVTIATLVLQILLFFPNWKFIVFKICQADIWTYSEKIITPLVSVLIPVTLAKISTFSILNSYIKLISASLIFLGIFILILILFNKPLLKELRNIIYPSRKEAI